MKFFVSIIVFSIAFSSEAQITPSAHENIDFLMTFGSGADAKWGDDDHTQIHFFVVPKNENSPIYIRVYDPNTGGKFDTKNGDFNTKCSYSLYAGRGVHSTAAARSVKLTTGYDAGKLILSKTFGDSPEYDEKWYTFGPLNPSEGEYSDEFGGYIFKMICKGMNGDDGNAYRYALSYKKDENVFVEDGNIFTYEMCFKLKQKSTETAHVYPFIKDNIVSITQRNFDADNDLEMRVTSIARKLVLATSSADGKWASNKYIIKPQEVNTTIDIQMVKKSDANNDMVMYILNQFNEAMPLFSVPIGGKPKYKHNLKVKTNF